MRALICLILCLLASPSPAQQPNFVFILTDDQSSGMMGCDGNPVVQTPHLDQLAKDGVFFNRAYITSAICTPSRISILLSQFERRHSVNFNSGTSVHPDAWAKSYPVLLRNAGYYTGYVGKNHSPIGPNGYDSGLMEKSFDYFYAGHGHIRFYPKEAHDIFKGAKSNTQAEIINESVDDFLSNEHRLDGAIRFLDKRPDSKPFCLSICFNLPHGAGINTMKQKADDDEIYKSLYRDRKVPLPKHFLARKDIKTPKLPPHVLNVAERQKGYDDSDTVAGVTERLIRQMQAMTGIDRLVGKLRAKLEAEGLSDNTIILFTSDHGLFDGEHGLGGKALCYEKTTHVPMIIYNPLAAANTRGRRSDELVQSIDLAPTMLDYAKLDRPAEFQGKSLRSLVEGSNEKVHDYIFTENLWATHFGNPRIEAVQNKEWKYIRYYKNNRFPASNKIKTAQDMGLPKHKFLYAVSDEDLVIYRHEAEATLKGEEPIYEELYHLAQDPDELHNLVDKPAHADVLKRMKAAWKERLTYARGQGEPKVLRYTVQSKLEAALQSP